MPLYEVTLKDQIVEVIDGADAYQQEGQMTTFFRRSSTRQVVDCWSTRVASFRTAEILIIRRWEGDAIEVEPAHAADVLPLRHVGA